MKQNLSPKPANQDELTLYCHMGEALCMTQVLEAALSHSITLKLNSTATKQIADESLTRHRSYTLGKAIKLSDKVNLYPSELQSKLNDFLQQRNWLAHNTMSEDWQGLLTEVAKNKLFQRIKSISNKAQLLQHEIELDMVAFCESKGRDMSKVLALMNKRYAKVTDQT